MKRHSPWKAGLPLWEISPAAWLEPCGPTSRGPKAEARTQIRNQLTRLASRERKALKLLHLPLDLFFLVSQVQGYWVTVQVSLEI